MCKKKSAGLINSNIILIFQVLPSRTSFANWNKLHFYTLIICKIPHHFKRNLKTFFV